MISSNVTDNFNVFEQDTPPREEESTFTLIYTKCCRLLCPPDGFLGHFLYLAIIFLLIWSIGAIVTGKTFLPGGNLFGIFIVGIASWTGAEITGALGLTQVSGIFLVGFGLRNIPYINVAADIDPVWQSSIKNLSAAMVLTSAGLGIKPNQMQKLKWQSLQLGIFPTLCEATTNAIVSHFLMHLPWIYATMLGFLSTGLSLIIVIPNMLVIQRKGLGEGKGIASLALSAGPIDNITTSIGYGIAFNIVFSKESTIMQVLHPILVTLLGIVGGAILGWIAWYLPSKSQDGIIFMRVTYLLAATSVVQFAGKEMGYAGCGVLGVVTLSFVAAYRWRQTCYLEEVVKAYDTLVAIFKPLLLGLVGAQFPIEHVNPKTAGLRICKGAFANGFVGCISSHNILFSWLALTVICIGLLVRLVCVYFIFQNSAFNHREKIFIVATWTPKVTFESAAAYTCLNAAYEQQKEDKIEKYCFQILVTAIMCIYITGPLGLAAIQRLAPKLLKIQDTAQDMNRINTSDTVLTVQSVNSNTTFSLL